MNNTIQYIITWLLGGNEEAAKQVGYTNDPSEWEKYRLVIVPNGNWGKKWDYPDWSNPHLDGKFVAVDIVYNTAFFISRAEELLNKERDEHGRFLAKYSILGKENRLMIPMLDEYSRFLIKALERSYEADGLQSPASLPKAEFSHIYLTHDIDALDQYRHWRGALGGILRGEWQQVKASWKDIQDDPAYKFPFFLEVDRPPYPLKGEELNDRGNGSEESNRTVIYFAKHTKGYGYDYPQYDRHGHDYVRLREALKRTGSLVGIHSSYYGLDHKTNHTLHRSHFLRCDIEQMSKLAGYGVTDDFTMGFADHAGFRLQTSRAVRWIDPRNWQLTELTLHPLTVMDCTLYNQNYMNLDEDEAFFYCERLFDKVKQNGGELVLLWHNTNPSNCPFHYTLYPKLIDLLKD